MLQTYTLRYMSLGDIPQVVDVDRLSFPMPWSARSYVFEVSDNQAGHMIVLEAVPETPPARGLMGMFQRLGGQSRQSTIVGYAGFWLIDGEAHVSTIAVHPDHRRRGLGEVLLAGMLSRGIALQAEYSVLEVRVSNESAINLYRKYEYDVVGQRKRYYRDNDEDAFLMHLAPLDEAYQERLAARLDKLRARVDYTDALARYPADPRRNAANR
jgi:[ribosomal protein S18]-alanine N-acetyltransferase